MPKHRPYSERKENGGNAQDYLIKALCVFEASKEISLVLWARQLQLFLPFFIVSFLFYAFVAPSYCFVLNDTSQHWPWCLLQGRRARDCWFWSGNSRCPAVVMVAMTESFYTPCPVGLSALPAWARVWGLEHGGHVKQTCWVGDSGRHTWFFAFKVSFCSGSIKNPQTFALFFIIITKTGGKLAWTAIALCAWIDL